MRLIQTNLAALVGASRVRVNHALDFFRKRNMMSHDSDGHITVLAADTFAQRARQRRESPPSDIYTQPMVSSVDDPVVVVPYEEAWPSLFEKQRARIERAIGPWVEEIEHVGSTAVPGLAAKPVIDIMVGVKSLDDTPIFVKRLEAIGYEYVPEFERQMPIRRYFRKLLRGRRTHQIHLVGRSDAAFWDRHVHFLDYLRRYPRVAEEYARLKHDLSGRSRDDRNAHTEAKTAFIREVVRRAEEGEQG